MKRGQAIAEGFINFPMGSADYPTGGGRGMFVKLVVLDEVVGQDDALGMCTGVSVYDFLQEILVGDDQRPVPVDVEIPEDTSPEETGRLLQQEQVNFQEWVRFHYPRYDLAEELAGASRPYRASIILGSTGWSGYSETTGNWHATFDDLTPEGQSLYRMLQALNPGCPVHLLTFLDT